MARPTYGQYRTTMPSGYVRVWSPDHPLAGSDGQVYEHRLVLYEAGLDPTGWEVHHKNRDRSDNRLENLELLAPGEHQRRHMAEPGPTASNQFGVWPVRKPASHWVTAGPGGC